MFKLGLGQVLAERTNVHATPAANAHVVVNEPLVLAHLVNILDNDTNKGIRCHLREVLQDTYGPQRGKGFEYAMVYAMCQVYGVEGGAPLSPLFEFHGVDEPPKWASEDKWELVTVERIEDTQNPGKTVLHVTKVLFPGVAGFAFTADEHSGQRESLRWFTTPDGRPFLCPDKWFGPDVMFALRKVGTDQLLLVCIQCKHKQNILPSQTMAALATTTPDCFFMVSEVRPASTCVYLHTKWYIARERKGI